jgi:hypothetical protein
LRGALGFAAGDAFGGTRLGRFHGAGSAGGSHSPPFFHQRMPFSDRSGKPAHQRGDFKSRREVESDYRGCHADDGRARNVEVVAQKVGQYQADESAGANCAAN